jgi:signal-transduction protein with cAMP-binding, CBS, and nucleotidyltransferase domain
VPPEASLREVARELADGEIGAVLVETPGGPVGVLSERDLVAAIAAGYDPEERQVADVLTADLVTARPHGRPLYRAGIPTGAAVFADRSSSPPAGGSIMRTPT